MSQRVPAFCPLCVSRCGCEAVVENGRLIAIEPDPSHPTGEALCAKGRASPELVEAPDRLLYPMERTRPKGDSDPGWRRISWDEALDKTAAAMRRIAAESGPEAVAFAVTTTSGTSISDAGPWINRLINAFGSPNNCNAYEICSWHRDFAGAFTTGTAIGAPDYERANCILLWGHNPNTSWLAAAGAVAKARARGAKLVVVDPRRVGMAVKADQFLPVRPGTDGALALSIAGEMVAHGWFDAAFVREWTNGAFLVREDTGMLLRASELATGGDPGCFVAWDEASGATVIYDPTARSYSVPTTRLALEGRHVVAGHAGPIGCRPAFALFADRCLVYTPEYTASVTGVPADSIRQTAHLLWHNRPVAYFTWNGLEQHANATQTARAHSILYALTGCIDTPGGNVHLAQVPVNDVSGVELRAPGQWKKSLGLADRPLGLGASGWITSDDLYRAVLQQQPYHVRGLVGFGTNLLLSHADAARGAEALRQLEFYVQTDLYLTPTASFADIVLPIASAWEREALAVGFRLDQAAAERVQWRPAIVPARGEARGDTEVIFDLAVRLGLGEHFWFGDIDAAMNHWLAPSGITLEQLRATPKGVRYPLATVHRKYRQNGFATPSRRIEIFSERLQAIGQPPLPDFVPPPEREEFPLRLTAAKSPLYCHSQHRNLPRLRRSLPEPIVEMSAATAAERSIDDGDWVAIVTPTGRVRAKARLVRNMPDGIVGTHHGWWQGCEELGLPGYNPLTADGANVNLVIGTESVDPVSGAPPHRSYCCEVQRHCEEPAAGHRTKQSVTV